MVYESCLGLYIPYVQEIPALPDIRLPGLSVISRHSLLLYLLHQPVLYAVLVLLPTIL